MERPERKVKHQKLFPQKNGTIKYNLTVKRGTSLDKMLIYFIFRARNNTISELLRLLCDHLYHFVLWSPKLINIVASISTVIKPDLMDANEIWHKNRRNQKVISKFGHVSHKVLTTNPYQN